MSLKVKWTREFWCGHANVCYDIMSGFMAEPILGTSPNLFQN